MAAIVGFLHPKTAAPVRRACVAVLLLAAAGYLFWLDTDGWGLLAGFFGVLFAIDAVRRPDR